MTEDLSLIRDSWITVADAIGNNFNKSIADVGCATGEFAAYLEQRFPSANIVGIEYLASLRLKAVENNKSIRFINGDVTEKTSVNEKFDTITMMGVLCIFDNYEQVIHNVISWLKPKGRLILFNMISEYDIDVFIKYIPSSANYKEDNLKNGWNIISEKSLQLVCEKNFAELRTVNPFTIGLDIKQKNDDLMRSWTEKDGNNIRQIYNATHIKQPFKLAIIEKKQ